ncbi:probable G-protein coupled receptor CG31760 [Octopus vulgaris]|uniref:Probable G-protein coupled receptor CG31760 n=1 Tax=Octopus vulgaris TaxID=6645 RepID=A0AA36B6C3_OCTVU|nr:probable G-protein coupled receptor CG31760 [Octopus vulgaris]
MTDVWQKRYNDTYQGEFLNDSIILVRYEDGYWSKPYFDCGGGYIWMMTYITPFFGFKNNSFYFKGTSGIDIDLEKVDINQCPQTDGSKETNVFAGSHRCRMETTKCIPIRGLGFRRGSYRCVCKDSFYFPNVTAEHRYFFGTDVEHEYEKAKRKEPNSYYNSFACLPCAPGCETCVDGSPCILALNWVLRSIVLGIAGLIMCCIPILIWFTVQYREVKVLKASSPLLMRIILLGAFFLYCPQIVGYFEASVITCCLRFWLREIGFSISYGALLLKTWRISVVFRVRSAQRIKISDADLIKRLVIIVLIFAAFLSGRTIAGRPRVVKGKHTSGLQAFQCSSDWWDHSAAIAELLFLLWGVRLCIVVRKAPSEFNESRFISWAIYNETLLSLFLNVSMIFFQDPFPSNPDLLYLVVFIHSQLTTTVTLAFLFGSKAYHVYKTRGKEQQQQQSHSTMLARTGKFVPGSKSTTAVLSTFTSSGNPSAIGDKTEEGENESFLEKDIQEEFRRLYTQLELLKQRNMKLGNPHLQHKLSAMTEAAKKDDLPESTPSSPNINGKRVVINLDDYHEATSL